MHSTRELAGGSFAVTVGGRERGLQALLPGFTEDDRLGVVVRSPGGGVGASLLVLAAVTAFYDVWRARGGEFFLYPDYFVFHAGRVQGDHRKLEIWPAHKEVVVEEASGEALLRAVNDRGITVLAVPDDGRGAAPDEGDGAMPVDGRGVQADVARETLASAARRIRTCLAYHPSGRVRGADVSIAGDAVTERYAAATLEVSDAAASGAAAARVELLRDGRPVETYRRIALDEALALLSGERRDGAPAA